MHFEVGEAEMGLEGRSDNICRRRRRRRDLKRGLLRGHKRASSSSSTRTTATDWRMMMHPYYSWYKKSVVVKEIASCLHAIQLCDSKCLPGYEASLKNVKICHPARKITSLHPPSLQGDPSGQLKPHVDLGFRSSVILPVAHQLPKTSELSQRKVFTNEMVTL